MDCSSLFWLHTPKTSSTLCVTLNHICCPFVYESFFSFRNQSIEIISGSGCASLRKSVFDEVKNATKFISLSSVCKHRFNRGHKPFDISDSQLSVVKSNSINSLLPKSNVAKEYHGIIFVRDPLRRLVSSFLDGRHCEGMPEKEKLKIRARHDTLSDDNETEKLLKSFDFYAQYPHFIGCQTKMLNGFECASPFPLVQQLPSNTSRTNYSTAEPSQLFGLARFDEVFLSKAVSRLRRFFFVGVFEQYTRSLNVLHALAGRNTTPHSWELFRYRSSPNDMAELLLRRLQEKGYSDPYDQALHEQAKVLLDKQERTIQESL